jgi:glucose-6-phosphate isomerase
MKYNVHFCQNNFDKKDSLYERINKIDITKYSFLNYKLSNFYKIIKHINSMECKEFVFFGAGGSSLGGQSLCAFGNNKVKFIESIDPDTWIFFTDSILRSESTLNKTCFVFISKSGETTETIAQLYKILEISKNIICISGNSESKENTIQNLCRSFNIRCFDHPPVGGRFSILTEVGLVPAYLSGLNIEEIMKSAHEAYTSFFLSDLSLNSLHDSIYWIMQNKTKNRVLFTYRDKLACFSRWARQLWAESLGKNGFGTDFILASGTADEHSQLQLYLDGPKDKIFSFIVDTLSRNDKIFDPYYVNNKVFLNKSLDDLLIAHQSGTIASIEKVAPVQVFDISGLDVYKLSALHMHFMIEILIIAELNSIDPLNQPSIEDLKLEISKRF